MLASWPIAPNPISLTLMARSYHGQYRRVVGVVEDLKGILLVDVLCIM